jgi:hypothetical protein
MNSNIQNDALDRSQNNESWFQDFVVKTPKGSPKKKVGSGKKSPTRRRHSLAAKLAPPVADTPHGVGEDEDSVTAHDGTERDDRGDGPRIVEASEHSDFSGDIDFKKTSVRELRGKLSAYAKELKRLQEENSKLRYQRTGISEIRSELTSMREDMELLRQIKDEQEMERVSLMELLHDIKNEQAFTREVLEQFHGGRSEQTLMTQDVELLQEMRIQQASIRGALELIRDAKVQQGLTDRDKKLLEDIKSELSSVREDKNMLSSIKSELQSVRESLKTLSEDQKVLKEEMKQAKAPVDWKGQESEQQSWESPAPVPVSARRASAKAAAYLECVSPRKEPMSPTKEAKKGLGGLMKQLNSLDPPSSPRKGKQKTLPSIAPHDASELFELQRKDKALKVYLKTREGLYDEKHLSVDIINGQDIICFKNRAYIPAVLRAKTIQYYQQNIPVVPMTALRKNCIWPEMETDYEGSTCSWIEK